MKVRRSTQQVTLSAVLIAIGLLIPVLSPLKIILEPASFTLASHVPIFIGMFISPTVGLAVALGTTAGFFIGGFPLIIVLRAFTHAAFAFLGGWMLEKKPQWIENKKPSFLFALLIGVIHAIGEVAVVSLFYFGGELTSAYYAKGFLMTVFILVGVGTIIHSMVDFFISQVLWESLKKNVKEKRDRILFD